MNDPKAAEPTSIEPTTGEIYIYLGFQQNTFFFLHTITNHDEFENQISHHIHNCMINQGLIHDSNTETIVFEVDPVNNTTNAVTISHVDNTHGAAEYDEENLGQQLKRLLSVERQEQPVLNFVYDYNIKGYLTYEIPFKIPTIDSAKIQTIVISNITAVKTSKPLSD